ncbi:hypothetical protein ACFPA8_02045 [Streptomyces ovatisporus]|uniref:Uncharacterized protein n=1 Tax=Streptomyces ovatisporus TaxID=1128682 RepID=A0ABV9A1I8_9ACTN
MTSGFVTDGTGFACPAASAPPFRFRSAALDPLRVQLFGLTAVAG